MKKKQEEALKEIELIMGSINIDEANLGLLRYTFRRLQVVLNDAGYGSENTKEQYDLVTDMNIIAKKYFTLKNIQPMYNKNVNNTKHKEPAEKIMVFVK